MVQVRLICLQSKCIFTILVLVLYISAARIALDHVGYFQPTLVELILWNLRLISNSSSRAEVKPDTCHHTLPAVPTDLG